MDKKSQKTKKPKRENGIREVLKNDFAWKNLEPFVVGVSVILLLQFIVFPALTIANTFLNLIGAGLGIGMGIFIYYYIVRKLFKKEEEKEGETELDYIPKKKSQKKKNK